MTEPLQAEGAARGLQLPDHLGAARLDGAGAGHRLGVVGHHPLDDGIGSLHQRSPPRGGSEAPSKPAGVRVPERARASVFWRSKATTCRSLVRNFSWLQSGARSPRYLSIRPWYRWGKRRSIWTTSYRSAPRGLTCW